MKTHITEDGLFGVTKSAVFSTETNLSRPAYASVINTTGAKASLWGEDNDFPQKVIKDVRRNPELGTLLDKQANLLYGGGLDWGIPTKRDDGTEYLKPVDATTDKEIRLFIRRSNISRYLLEAAKDLYWFYNVFPEVVLSVDGKKVAQLCTQASEECRYGLQNNKGIIEFCYINAQWGDGAKPDSKETKKVPVLDPYYSPSENLKEFLKKKSDQRNFIYPLNYANPGNKFYQLADWNSIRESGWLAVSELLPKFKKALLENQSTIKYHIQISDKYWTIKFDGYDTKTLKEKTAIKKNEIEVIQGLITGAEKAGVNFWSAFYSDLNQGKDNDLIKISPIDDKIKDGKYLDDGKDASAYTMSAVGLHPALVGTTPSSGLGGAGSNIREAYNLHMLTNKSRQDLILEPLNNLIIEFNGWPVEMEFRFKNQFMTTLDTNTEVSNKPQKQTTE